MALIYKYKEVKATSPNEATLSFKNDNEATATQLCQIDGWSYVSIPDLATIPEQHNEIQYQVAVIDELLAEQIKNESRVFQLIDKRFKDKVRAKYSIDDELYFARINIGALTNRYTMRAGESDEVDAFGVYVENARDEAKQERAVLGF